MEGPEDFDKADKWDKTYWVSLWKEKHNKSPCESAASGTISISEPCKAKVPPVCCKLDGMADTSLGNKDLYLADDFNETCPITKIGIHEKGCKTLVSEKLNKKIGSLTTSDVIMICVSVFAFYLVGQVCYVLFVMYCFIVDVGGGFVLHHLR